MHLKISLVKNDGTTIMLQGENLIGGCGIPDKDGLFEGFLVGIEEGLILDGFNIIVFKTERLEKTDESK